MITMVLVVKMEKRMFLYRYNQAPWHIQVQTPLTYGANHRQQQLHGLLRRYNFLVNNEQAHKPPFSQCIYSYGSFLAQEFRACRPYRMLVVGKMLLLFLFLSFDQDFLLKKYQDFHMYSIDYKLVSTCSP